MADRKMTQLAAPEAAIASYLDELLHTATSTALQDEQVQPEPEPLVAHPEPEPEPPKPVKTEAKPVTRARPRPIVQAPVVEQKAPEPVQTEAPVTAPGNDGEVPPARPEWSEEPFECLIFTVAGLQLAVPLVLLGAIHRIEEEIRPIPGSPRWYMGIRPDRDHNLRVVDTAEWIMAGRVPAGARDNYRFVIRLDDSEWGLACDDVAQSFTLRPDEVRWRTARSKRPWLAGTVVDHMCALIDVRTMAHLLVRAEREHHLDLS
ncbi:CheW domain-containing protein [Marinobacter nauticus]|uniref:chemotaxis protein CheW n=1 Tax=Marinobacter nauticus TaxID=2743 RepID=UPI00112FB09E|nr:chemotaxis protein CheW [Marinobacter nauticus]TPW23628.1 CheW domain-containing protein [Marinobacter nauticus]